MYLEGAETLLLSAHLGISLVRDPDGLCSAEKVFPSSAATTENFSFNCRLLSLSGTTTATLVLVSNALKKLPLLFVGQSFWPNYLSYLYDEAIGATRSASRTPCLAR